MTTWVLQRQPRFLWATVMVTTHQLTAVLLVMAISRARRRQLQHQLPKIQASVVVLEQRLAAWWLAAGMRKAPVCQLLLLQARVLLPAQRSVVRRLAAGQSPALERQRLLLRLLVVISVRQLPVRFYAVPSGQRLLGVKASIRQRGVSKTLAIVRIEQVLMRLLLLSRLVLDERELQPQVPGSATSTAPRASLASLGACCQRSPISGSRSIRMWHHFAWLLPWILS